MQQEREKLQRALAKIVKEYRLEKKKSISLIADEIDMAKSMWSDLEHGEKDPQFSTIWRIAEGLDIPLSTMVKRLEKELGTTVLFLD